MVVGIATRHRTEVPAIESRWRKFFSHPSIPTSEAHPASRTMGTGSLFPGIKRPMRGADHPPRFEPKFKIE